MLKSVRRMATGVKSLSENDHGYFTESRSHAGRSHFRDDLRAIIGGALAAAFTAAAITSLIHVPGISEGAFTAMAAFAGGIAGKVFLA